MRCKKTSKNQLTLPGEIVKLFPGTDYFDISVKGGKIVLEPVSTTPVEGALEGVRDKMQKLGIREADVAGAIRWARKKQQQ